jgi:hypothetical protein
MQAAAELRLVGAVGEDGHHLLTEPGGSAIWGPLFDAYLKDRGH